MYKDFLTKNILNKINISKKSIQNTNKSKYYFQDIITNDIKNRFIG